MRSVRESSQQMRRFVVALAVTGWVAIALSGCGSSGSTAPKTGSLTVTITAPAGATPSVTVSGPAGYHKTLIATQTLTGLATGSYTVTAASVLVSNPIVATVDTAMVTGGAATVSAGATATASVSYAARPGSGALWVVNFTTPDTVVAYTAAQLAASTGAAPATVVGVTGGQLFGAAFDANGNLWIANFGGSSVVQYAASQLAASGNPTPAVTLSAAGGSLNGPDAPAFDASGNLWVANSGDSTVVEFTVGELAASGSPTPAVTLSATGGSLNIPYGPAFDGSGNLWVANFGDSTVVEFAASQLAASGSPTPAVTLSATGGSLTAPIGLAFDASGDLWVINDRGLSSSVVEFAASQLVTSGAPTPNVMVSGSSLTSPVGLAFDPPPANLPLK